MKNVIYILIVSTLFTACTDILDKPLLDEVSEQTYWHTPTDLKLYINQFYPRFGGRLAFYSLDASSDNLQPIAPSEILAGTRSVPASGNDWDWNYIRKVNYFINNAERVVAGDQEEINQYIGEGFFFRAYFYFNLVKKFGDIPWYSEVLNIDSKGLQAARDPRNEVIDSIIADLDSAIGLLGDKKNIPVNRLNRGCALLLKSRVCLYEGTWEKYHAGTAFGVSGSQGERYLRLAAQSAKTLIDEDQFKIYSTGNPDVDYWQLFNRLDLSGNEEVLLSQAVDPTLGLGSGVWTYLNGFRGNQTGVTKQLVDSYLADDGFPISVSSAYQGDTTLKEVVMHRDLRLEQTIWVPGQVQINTQPDPIIFKSPSLYKGSADMATTGYMIRKGSTPDPEQNQGTSGANYGKTDGIVFRYAEVLLNYAEAKAELEEITQDVLDKTINVLRDRVGMPHLAVDVPFVDPNWPFPKLSPILNEIRRERRVELALEGFRYDDLMRWAAANLIQGKRWKGARFILGKSFPDIEDQISAILVDQNRYIDRYQNSLPNGFGFNEKRDYLYPIPTNELTLNRNLEQNPEW